MELRTALWQTAGQRGQGVTGGRDLPSAASARWRQGRAYVCTRLLLSEGRQGSNMAEDRQGVHGSDKAVAVHIAPDGGDLLTDVRTGLRLCQRGEAGHVAEVAQGVHGVDREAAIDVPLDKRVAGVAHAVAVAVR